MFTDHQSLAINLSTLKKLRRHMRKHHPIELAEMMAASRADKMTEMYFGGGGGAELAALNDACVDPRLFPLHVLADDKVVKLIKRGQRGTLGSLWLTAGYTLFQVWRN